MGVLTLTNAPEYNLKALREQEFRKHGKFHTPKPLAQHMRKFFPQDVAEIYDPTVGWGALLSVFGDEVEKYGQDIDQKGIEVCSDYLKNFQGVHGDLLLEPAFKEKRFKYIIANPPYSVSYDPTALKEDIRFQDLPVYAPKSKADFMFVKHIIHMLADDGMAVCLLHPGTLYRGNAEGKIRKWLVEENYIERIEEVDKNQFVDTAIATVLVIFKKQKTKDTITIVRPCGTHEATVEEIAENNYNLSPASYVVEEIEKEPYNPYYAEEEARELIYEQLRNSLEFSMLAWENFPELNPDPAYLLNGCQRVLDDFKKLYEEKKKRLIAEGVTFFKDIELWDELRKYGS